MSADRTTPAAFGLVYRSVRVFHIAFAGFFLIPPYVTYAVNAWLGIPIGLSILSNLCGKRGVEMIEVTSVSVVEDFALALTFNTGERKRFDMRPYLDYPVFRPLANPGFFSLARVDYGTVTWPGEIDIAPERLYAESVEVGE